MNSSVCITNKDIKTAKSTERTREKASDDQREYLDESWHYKIVTIKKPYDKKKPIFKADIDRIAEKHLSPVVILDQTYEIDKSWVLHCHYLVLASIHWVPMKIRYWKLDVQPCRNKEAWLSYINKSMVSKVDRHKSDQQDQILLTHESHYLNLFNDGNITHL